MQVFLYIGPEEFRKREELAGQLRKKQYSLQDLQSYHGSSVNLDELKNALLAPPLFGGVFPVLLTDIELLSARDQKRLLALCQLCRQADSPPTLFFLFSKERKLPAILAKGFPKSEQKIFRELSEDEKKSHIAIFCRRHGKEIEDSAIDILLERVSGDLLTLERTLATVFLYLESPGGASAPVLIREELLAHVFTQSRDATVYDLFHYMVERNLDRSLQTLDSLLLQRGSKAAALIIQLIYQWDRLLQIKERMRYDTFEEVCSVEYVRTKALKADLRQGVEKYSLAELRQVQKINQDTSLNIKLSGGLQDILIKHYVYQITTI